MEVGWRDRSGSTSVVRAAGELAAVGAGGGEDPGERVSLEGPAAVVDEGVVAAAEQAAVVEVGGAVVFPWLEVVWSGGGKPRRVGE